MDSEKVKEIKKALECCANWNGQSSCKDCPIGVEKCFEDENLMPKLALTLINELESENERLENEKYKLEQNLGQCENGYKLELHTARHQLYTANEDLKKAEKRIAELEEENEDYNDRLNNLQTYIDNHEKIWGNNTNNALKQFAERLKDKFNDTEYRAKTKRKTISVEELKAQMDWILHEVVIESIDETLKEFINGKV